VQEFVDALKREDAKVDVDRLNDLRRRADILALEYTARRNVSQRTDNA
jgi:hypothetical protein